MALVTYTIPNLINGVSQQAEAVRRDTQGDLMDNGWASVVEGLQKRPPIENVAKLTTDTDLSSSFVHAINRDITERYVTIFGPSTIQVWGVDGTSYQVETPDGVGYLPADPSTQLRVVTVDDYSFVVNSEQTIAMSGTTPTLGNDIAFVEIRAAAYQLDYTIEVKDGDGTYWVKLTTANDAPHNNTSTIAEDLASSTTLDTNPSVVAVREDSAAGTAGLQDLLNAQASDTYVVTLDSNVIKIENTSGNSFTVDVTDGAADTHILSVKDEVEAFTDLPTRCEDGFTAKVVSDASTGSSAYWVAFERLAGTTGIGVGKWVETVDPSIDSTLDSSTMPHVLVRRFDDGSGTITGTPNAAYFSFEEFDWDDRVVGDINSNPEPSFVGTTARDIFFWRDRLGILTPADLVLSEAGYYGNFFRITVTSLLDSAPIDLAISDNQVSNMMWAVPDEQDLVLFSDQTQYILSSSDLLTPSSVSVRATTRYEADRNVRPILIGDRVYFPQQNGGFVGVREYFIDPDTQKRQADEITIHVNRYLEGTVKDMTGSAQSRAMLVATTGSRYVYLYQWFSANNTKLQSAWSRWDLGLGDSLLGFRFIDTTLYIVSQRSDGVYLEKIETDPGRADYEDGIIIHLDRRVSLDDVVKVYDSVADTTTITLPYPCDGVTEIIPLEATCPDSCGDSDFSGTYYGIERCTDGVEPPVYVQDDEFSLNDVFVRNDVCYKVVTTSETNPPLTSVLRAADTTSVADCATCTSTLQDPDVMAPPLAGTTFLRMARCDDDSMGEYSITEQIMGFPAGDDLTKIYELDGVCYYVTNVRENTPSDPLFPVMMSTIHDDCGSCSVDISCTDCSPTGAGTAPESAVLTGIGNGASGSCSESCSGANGTYSYSSFSDTTDYCEWTWTGTGGSFLTVTFRLRYYKNAGTWTRGECSLSMSAEEVAVGLDINNASEEFTDWLEKTTGFTCISGKLSGSHTFGSLCSEAVGFECCAGTPSVTVAP